MKYSRRDSFKVLTVTSAVVTLDRWVKPLLNTVLLPAHAQTSNTGSVLSCSMMDSSSNSIVDGQTINQNFTLLFSTNPPEPGGTVSWVGRCNGIDDFSLQNNVLDLNGQLEIQVQTMALCSGGPPNNGDVILHNGVLDSSGSTTSCSVVYTP